MVEENNILQRVWDVELDILDVIHAICVKYNLRYSLAFGTLIGAVRHGGFIPWDDDIDIVMPRDDYNMFLSVWENVAPDGYLIQYKDINADFEQNFAKIRKKQTTFLQDECERTKAYHKGIFVDICPCDRVAPGKFLRLAQYFACAVELLYTKEHFSGTSGIIGILERVLLCVPRRIRPGIRRVSTEIKTLWNHKNDLNWFCTDTIQNCRRYFPNNMFDQVALVSFQGKQYYAFSNPDSFLRVRYGDYMQLPPEEERVWKHHPIIIDFEHNYEELNIQK